MGAGPRGSVDGIAELRLHVEADFRRVLSAGIWARVSFVTLRAGTPHVSL